MLPTSFRCVQPTDERLTSTPDDPQEHPGGIQIILKYAGRDATAAYKPIHPSDALEKNLPKEKCLGPVSLMAKQELQTQESLRKKTKDEIRVEEAQRKKPALKRILSLQDMEVRPPLYSTHPFQTPFYRTLPDRFYRTRRTPTTPPRQMI